jgi:hypothetical protein
MQIYRFKEDGTELSRRIIGRVQQSSDKVETVYVTVDGINPTDYAASLVCTPNGATESITLEMDQTSFVLDGITYQGFKKELPSAVTAVAGPLAMNIYVEDVSTTLVTATSSVYVNASGGVEWDEPINYSQWKELIANILSLKGQFLGDVSDLSVLDDYKTSASSGLYWFYYQNSLWVLSVLGGATAKQTALVFASNQSIERHSRSYSSSWTSWAVEALAAESDVADLRLELTDGSLVVARATGDENGNDIFATYLSKSAASSTYETKTDSASKLSEAKTYADGVGSAITATKGQANGICCLDSNAKVLLSEIPDSLLGSQLFGGVFAPSTGIATVNDNFKSKFSYSQSTLTITAGNSSLYLGVYFLATDSATFLSVDFAVGDWIVSNGSAGWVKIDNTDAVKSVNGKTGIVVISKSDVGLGNVDNTSDLDKPISNAQSAVNSVTVKKTSNLTLTIASTLSSLGKEIAIDGQGGSYIAVVWLNGSTYDGRFIGTQKNGVRSFFGLSGTTTLADAFSASVTDYAKLISGTGYAAMVGVSSVSNAGYYEIIDSTSSSYLKGNIYLLNSSGVSTLITTSDTGTISLTKANKLVFTNLIIGGSFASGSTTGWITSGCNISASTGELVATSTGSTSFFHTYYNFTFVSGHKYYIRFTYHSSSDVTDLKCRFIFGDGSSALNISTLIPGSTSSATLSYSSVALLPLSVSSHIGISIIATNASPTSGSTFAIDNIDLIDCSESMGLGNECSPSYMNDALIALYPSTSGWFEGTIYPFDLKDTCMKKQNKIACTNRYANPDYYNANSYYLFANCLSSSSYYSGIITLTGDGLSTSFSIDNADSYKYVPVNAFRKFYGSIWVEPASLTGLISAELSLVVKDSSNNLVSTVSMATFTPTSLLALQTANFVRVWGVADFSQQQANYPTSYKMGLKITFTFDTNAHQAIAIQMKKPLFIDLTYSYGKDLEPTGEQFSNTLIRYSDYWFAGTEDVLSENSIDTRLYQIETNQPLTDINISVSEVIAGKNQYFYKASGDGTSTTPYIIKPRTGAIRQSMNRYVVTIGGALNPQPSSTTYINLAPNGSQSCMIYINKNIDTSGWAYHLIFNVLDHSGYPRFRYSQALNAMTNAAFTSASALLYHASFDCSVDEIYSTVTN